jgi:AcrR family transcriptional regulator
MTPVAAVEAPPASDQAVRIVEAAVRCIARWGVGKTTVDDVAREAGVSRATVYRVFPGGKDRIVELLLRHELSRFFDQVRTRLDAAETLEDLVTEGMTEAMRFVQGHEALRYLLLHEPELVLPFLAFHRAGQLLTAAAAFTAPHLARFLPPERADAAAEWVARVALSYALDPSPSIDPDDGTSIRRLVRTFVLPGLTTTDTRGASAPDLRTT